MKRSVSTILLIILFIAYLSCSKSANRYANNNTEEEKIDIDTDVVVNVEVDNEGPVIILTKPQIATRGLAVVKEEEELDIAGRVSDISGISQIKVNNIKIEFNLQGCFDSTIPFPKDNLITIIATDRKNNSTEKVYKISSQLPEEPNKKRIAFIIGNSDYDSLKSLRNPENDVDSMANVLRSLNFDVQLYKNLRLENFKSELQKFKDKISNDCAVLFYYAGHGVQINGNNYLVPVDVFIRNESEVYEKCLCMKKDILCGFEGYSKNTNVIILDACRDNPFEGFTTRGLAQMGSLPENSIIAFSAAENQVALDGDGANSPFTEELLSSLKIPGLKAEEVFKLTRIGVRYKTNNVQNPATYNTLTTDFYFVEYINSY